MIHTTEDMILFVVAVSTSVSLIIILLEALRLSGLLRDAQRKLDKLQLQPLIPPDATNVIPFDLSPRQSGNIPNFL